MPTVADVVVDFVPLEIFAFLVALAVEHLIGNDARAAIARLAGSPRAKG